MEPEVVLYHALSPETACDDGFASGYVAWKFMALDVRRNMEFIPCVHNHDPPWDRIIGKRVLVADFSWPRKIMERMAKNCAQLVVLDHHVSAERHLKGLPFAHFRMDRSGAGMTYEYLFPGLPVPRLIQYVQDNDLWKHELPRSRAIAAWIRSEYQNFENWKYMETMLETTEGFETAAGRGDAILREQERVVREIARQAWVTSSPMGKIAYVHCPVYQSEVGEVLAKDADIVVIWRFNVKAEIVLSFRTRKPGLDISRLAEELGGGGHAQSAGATITPGAALETAHGQVRAHVWKAAERLADDLAGKPAKPTVSGQKSDKRQPKSKPKRRK
jgi:oligoribonuclease NrnB/cAMP/cGMP phosphodiesterase (DHH superfamily)